MSAVEQFSGGVQWTTDDIFSGTLSKSDPFIMHFNGQDVSFTLSAVFLPPQDLQYMYKWHVEHISGTSLRSKGYANQQVAIYVKSSIPIDLVPKLELMDNDWSWCNLPISWMGPDGTTCDKMFFGSTKFMDNVILKDAYTTNGKLKVKCTIPKVLSAPLVSLHLQSDLKRMFEDGLHADMVLVSEGKEIKVSKGILAARSSVFLAMFKHQLEETKSGRVNITDVKYEPLCALIQYLYTDTVDLNDCVQFVIELFVAADKYDVRSLRTLSEMFISNNISDANVIDAINISKALNSLPIKQACLDYIANKPKTEVLTIPSLDQLDGGLFAEVLGKLCKELNC